MKKERHFQTNDFKFLVVLLVLSIIALVIVTATPKSCITEKTDEIKPINNEKMKGGEEESVPLEVLDKAEKLCDDELRYVQTTFCTAGYTESRLERTMLVHICNDVEGEIFEVYEATYLYRTSREAGWETHAGYPSTYLVFCRVDDSKREWVCCFRDTSVADKIYFEKVLHECLMDNNEKFLYELNAGTNLDTTIKKTMEAIMCRILPGDAYFLVWKPLAVHEAKDQDMAYGLLLYYSNSGSPLIYSDKTGEHDSAIFSACWLPVAISYRKDYATETYTMTGYLMPSEEKYEEDVRDIFPPDTADYIFENIDMYASEILKQRPKNDYVWHLFSGGPVWPGYYFNEALETDTLLGLVKYYGERDIYTTPIREELAKRFSNDPDAILSVLNNMYDEEFKDYIFGILN